MKREVSITYLELQSAVPSPTDVAPEGVELRKTDTEQPELNRFLYTAVGGDWYWIDRLPWDYGDWEKVLRQDGYETWILLKEGSIAGYFELEKKPAGEYEIAYFGLLPQYLGRGLGRYLLSRAVQRCRELGAVRVTVNTCTLDHPGALQNYIARGFQPVRTVTVLKELPDRPVGAWPGAGRRTHGRSPDPDI